MSIRADKLRDESPERASKGRATAELWEVWDSKDGTPTGDYNESGLVDPQQFEAVAGLPTYGNPHPVLAGALVVGVRVQEVIANWSYIVRVTYRGWGLYSGGPRPLSASYGEREPSTTIPIFQSVNNAANTVTAWFFNPYPWQRDRSIRIETRFINGTSVNVVQDAIDANAGKWYNIGTPQNPRFALLCAGRCSAYFDGLSRIRVNYAFETWAAHPGIPQGTAQWRNAVAVPALNGLQSWDWVVTPGINVPPVILVVDHGGNSATNTLPGGALPGYP